jgi:cell division septal protein FtsQ
LIALEPDASVWDRVEPLEERIRAHPMIREATVRREGLHGLSVVVIEKRPVAFIATPELRAVNGAGRVLPIEPAETALNLPLISGVTEVEGDVVLDEATRQLADVLDQLDRADADFVAIISEASMAPDGGYRFLMLPTADAASVFLPSLDPVSALNRVSLALGQIEDPRVDRADARYARQVVLTRSGGR